jgi:hypothetical protein
VRIERLFCLYLIMVLLLEMFKDCKIFKLVPIKCVVMPNGVRFMFVFGDGNNTSMFQNF